MIHNDREYRITQAAADRFRQGLAELAEQPANPAVHPLLRKAEREGMESQLADLEQELREYERLQRGAPKVLTVRSLAELPRLLIRARIASGLNQRQLAERLGLRQQQIQRYESTEYAAASLSRLLEVLQAMNLRLRGPAIQFALRSPRAMPPSRERKPSRVRRKVAISR